MLSFTVLPSWGLPAPPVSDTMWHVAEVGVADRLQPLFGVEMVVERKH